jgi:hypothetical protein
VSKKDSAESAPKAPKPQGPLGPWRLSISVLVALGFTGMPLWQTAQTGVGLDMALLRSFGVAFITWIATGRLNRMLVTEDTPDEVESEVDVHDEPTGEHPVTQPTAG